MRHALRGRLLYLWTLELLNALFVFPAVYAMAAVRFRLGWYSHAALGLVCVLLVVGALYWYLKWRSLQRVWPGGHAGARLLPGLQGHPGRRSGRAGPARRGPQHRKGRRDLGDGRRRPPDDHGGARVHQLLLLAAQLRHSRRVARPAQAPAPQEGHHGARPRHLAAAGGRMGLLFRHGLAHACRNVIAGVLAPGRLPTAGASRRRSPGGRPESPRPRCARPSAR